MAEYYDPDTYPEEWNYLQSGTIIDEYIIERELAHGGFSSVYLARQTADQIQVAIKEYLPRKLAHRTWNNVVVPNDKESKPLFIKGRSLFFEEAKVLANLKHSSIVEVINFFQANETVYMVMTYDYGITLDGVIRDKSFDVTEDFLVKVFSRLLTGINLIHQKKILHLDIKPKNILIRPDNEPLLLDFGAIQKYPRDNDIRQAKVVSQGFSPTEQYTVKEPLGPWSDIYSVGASMRFCLDEKTPVSAENRVSKETLIPAVKAHKKKYPEYLLKAIDWAMELDASKRPQAINELQRCFINK